MVLVTLIRIPATQNPLLFFMTFYIIDLSFLRELLPKNFQDSWGSKPIKVTPRRCMKAA